MTAPYADDPEAAELAEWLKRWSSWIRWNLGELRPLWYPAQASAMGEASTNYCTAEDDGEVYWEQHFVPAILGALDACIDSLPPDHKRAVWFAHGITKVPPPDAANLYACAFGRLHTMMAQRIVLA